MVKVKKLKKIFKKTKDRKLIKAVFSGDEILSNSKEARDLYSQSLFGEYIDRKIHYSFSEALYLVDRGKIVVYSKTKKLGFNQILEKCRKCMKQWKNLMENMEME